MYYLGSENKGDDQLGSYRTVDFIFVFAYMQKADFLMMQLNFLQIYTLSVLLQQGPRKLRPEIFYSLVYRPADSKFPKIEIKIK